VKTRLMTTGVRMTTVTRVLKTAIVLGLAASLASCASARR